MYVQSSTHWEAIHVGRWHGLVVTDSVIGIIQIMLLGASNTCLLFLSAFIGEPK